MNGHRKITTVFHGAPKNIHGSIVMIIGGPPLEIFVIHDTRDLLPLTQTMYTASSHDM
jgi:hypothetical protein